MGEHLSKVAEFLETHRKTVMIVVAALMLGLTVATCGLQ